MDEGSRRRQQHVENLELQLKHLERQLKNTEWLLRSVKQELATCRHAVGGELTSRAGGSGTSHSQLAPTLSRKRKAVDPVSSSELEGWGLAVGRVDEPNGEAAEEVRAVDFPGEGGQQEGMTGMAGGKGKPEWLKYGRREIVNGGGVKRDYSRCRYHKAGCPARRYIDVDAAGNQTTEIVVQHRGCCYAEEGGPGIRRQLTNASAVSAGPAAFPCQSQSQEELPTPRSSNGDGDMGPGVVGASGADADTPESSLRHSSSPGEPSTDCEYNWDELNLVWGGLLEYGDLSLDLCLD